MTASTQSSVSPDAPSSSTGCDKQANASAASNSNSAGSPENSSTAVHDGGVCHVTSEFMEKRVLREKEKTESIKIRGGNG